MDMVTVPLEVLMMSPWRYRFPMLRQELGLPLVPLHAEVGPVLCEVIGEPIK
jgi:hypothetical protein